MELVAANGSNREYAVSLLEASGLPIDLDGAEVYVARRGGNRVGCGGLEVHGSDALLRSIAVDSVVRGEGYGSEITDRLCAIAADRGVSGLYLLTTTAAGFFENRSFERIDRERVPDPIARTSQFTTTCPASATCMRRVR
ncbi:N-acetylglutamate synthase [Halalkalicoccus paucihalophilus]|uniref:N-acetylglutamate synthase n=1 Tax=Halalkalicoccus paucihalophilus TaxID=1008153 RepID=A0A151AHU0_9EURY|nr:arsenic resistance N-acetyltransferase ArsN2 [Halalkalicoccus paucihalophilus]KYH27246.1 N-acetylglutamate synthase [Halalkalicoccus paucihalophilus]